MTAQYDPTEVAQKIKDRVTHDEASGCWVWPTKSAKHYAHINVAGKTLRVHRLSYEIFVGPIPDGMWVLHKCDNPPCVNPAHLSVGTARENYQDMMAKGRDRHLQFIPRNTDDSRTLLDENLIPRLAARVNSGERITAIAEEHGVHRATMYGLVRGRRMREFVARHPEYSDLLQFKRRKKS